MSYINDPREMTIHPNNGMMLEQDNRHEEMYQWGAMIVDLCDLPVEEYMKPMTVIGLGGGSPETGDTMYILKFVVDNVTVAQESLKSGDPIPFTVNAEKDGRNFLGWFYGSTNYSEGSLMPSRNLTLTAKYSCDVSFVFIIDGIEEEVSAYTVTYGSKPSSIPSVNKPGYNFLGWEPSTSSTITEHTTFKGSFESITYIVTWSGYTDGVLTQDYKYGETLIEPTKPEKEGYTFTGWDKTVPEIVTSNLSFNAKFTINKYNITYHEVIDGIESSPLSSVTLTYNSSIPTKNKLVKSGYTYTDWKGYNSETEEEYNGVKMPSFNLKYITIRTTNEYILSYYDNNELIKEENYLYNTEVVPFVYEKEGWTVSEWEGLPTLMPYHNVSAYCTSFINTYEVKFVDQDGNEYIVEAQYGTPIKDIIPVIDGKTFELPIEFENETVGSEPIIIQGNVSVNNYKVVITINGIDEEVELPFGTNVEIYIHENYKPEEGYHLVIDSSHETVPSDGSLVVNVTYAPNIWILSYHTTGAFDDMNGSKEVAFGTPILNELPEISKLEGYDFDGWYNGDSKITETDLMPNHNLYVNGEYVVKSFNVIIKDGDIIIVEKTYEYGTSLSEVVNDEVVTSYLKELELNGYNGTLMLNGEIIDENSIITSDIEINVERSEKEYLLTFMNGDIIISSTNVKFNSIIEYPIMENYTENGIDYVFYWEDESYNGKLMPNYDVIIKGFYKEKEESPIYYGVFVTPNRNPDSSIFNNEELNTNFKTIKVADCFDGEEVSIVMEADENAIEFIENDDWDGFDEYCASHLYPSCFLLPVDIANNYTFSAQLNAGGLYLETIFTSDNVPINIDGINYYLYTYLKPDTMMAGDMKQVFVYKITLK